jgi:hypothetical protein
MNTFLRITGNDVPAVKAKKKLGGQNLDESRRLKKKKNSSEIHIDTNDHVHDHEKHLQDHRDARSIENMSEISNDKINSGENIGFG